MMLRKIILSLYFGLLVIFADAQKPGVLTFEDFIERVGEHHPMALQADLRIDQALAMLRTARGGFDPKVSGGFNTKDLQDKDYYELLSLGLKVPTWAGVSVNAGFDESSGQFVDPQNSTPTNGVGYLGVSISLGRGLFMDERRAMLRKAEIAQDLNEAERRIMMNELLLDASVAYWNWFAAFHTLEVANEAVLAAQQRFNAVLQTALGGDVPLIDTLEASIQLQNRVVLRQDAQIDMIGSKAALESFLWSQGLLPLELDTLTTPESLALVSATDPSALGAPDVDELMATHPELNRSISQIGQLEVERQWKLEQIKPTVDLKYNALSTRRNDNLEFGAFNENDRTLGVDVAFPLFLRKERGSLKMADLKIADKGFELEAKRRNLRLKFDQAREQWRTLDEQYSTISSNADDAGRLLQGERDLFDMGESSLFMVNSRELTYISARTKSIASLAKNRIADMKTRYALGTIANN